MNRATVVRNRWGVILLLIFLPAAAAAQETTLLTLQAGGCFNLPIGSFNRSDGAWDPYPQTGYAGSGTGYALTALVGVSSRISFYAEYMGNRFGTDVDEISLAVGISPSTNPDIYYTAPMIGVGMRVTPLPRIPLHPYLQAGLTRYRMTMKIEAVSLTNSEESDRISGWNIGAGCLLPVGPLSLDLGARYHTARVYKDDERLGWNANWLEARLLVSVAIAR